MRRKHKRIIICLSAVIVILAALCIKTFIDLKQAEKESDSVRKTYSGKSSELDTKIKDMDTKLSTLQDKYYEDKLSKLLGKDQLISLQKAQWKYELKVNETPFKEDHIYINKSEFVMTFSERQLEEKLLPLKMHNKGALVEGDELDKFYDHIKVDTQLSYERKIQTYKNYTNVFYGFKNVPVGTIITLRLSEPLKERLNLGYDKLEIIVNKLE